MLVKGGGEGYLSMKCHLEISNFSYIYWICQIVHQQSRSACSKYAQASIILYGILDCNFFLLFLQVKKVLQFMIYATYNSHLEISFLMDEAALPPVVSDPSNEMQTPSGTSITTPLTASESISEGLALMQGDNKEMQDEDKQGKAAKTGIKEKMSNMRKLFGTKASTKGHRKTSSVSSTDDGDGKCEDFVVLGETDAESGSVDSEEVISQELAEAMTDTDTPSMTVSSQVEESEPYLTDNSPSEEVAPQPVVNKENCDDVDKTSEQEQDQNTKQDEDNVQGQVKVSDTQRGSVTDFDHEATTKKLVSHLDPNVDDRSADSVSIASFEDVPGVGSGPGGSEKGSCFADALNITTLSVSPFIKYSIPYTETSTGKASKLKKYLSPELFWSARFSPVQPKKQTLSEPDVSNDRIKSVDRCSRISQSVYFREPHPFTFSQLTHSANEETTRALLADFRARGGRIVANHRFDTGQDFLPPVDTATIVQSPEMTLPRRIDCLDLYLHQHIALQFSSYSHKSSNAPNHCVHPWVVTMEFYRRHDLTLGEFLEKFCFR